MILSIQYMLPYAKDATRKVLELINEFGKVARYNINTHHQQKVREIKEIIPFTITVLIFLRCQKTDESSLHKITQRHLLHIASVGSQPLLHPLTLLLISDVRLGCRISLKLKHAFHCFRTHINFKFLKMLAIYVQKLVPSK